MRNKNLAKFALLAASLVATVSVNPLTLEIFAPSTIYEGRTFKLEARVGSLSEESRIRQIKAEIFAPSGLEVKGSTMKKLGVIREKDERKIIWPIKAEDSGTHVILVDVSVIVEETQDLVTLSDTILIKVIPEKSFLKIFRLIFARIGV